MKSLVYTVSLCASACVVLVACGAQKNKAFDLYALPTTSVMPVDNDAYYVPPRTKSYCANSINDSPSCGGI